jgi:hypothetical protein
VVREQALALVEAEERLDLPALVRQRPLLQVAQETTVPFQPLLTERSGQILLRALKLVREAEVTRRPHRDRAEQRDCTEEVEEAGENLAMLEARVGQVS